MGVAGFLTDRCYRKCVILHRAILSTDAEHLKAEPEACVASGPNKKGTS